jgi:hypothetical protein
MWLNTSVFSDLAAKEYLRTRRRSDIFRPFDNTNGAARCSSAAMRLYRYPAHQVEAGAAILQGLWQRFQNAAMRRVPICDRGCLTAMVL